MATALSLAPCRDGKRLMNDAIRINGGTEEEIYIKDLLQLTVSCCLDDEGPEYRRALVNNFTNIPRYYRFCCHDNDTMSLTLDGHRCKDDKENNQPASFYRNGGRKENKIAPEEKFTVQEGDVLIFRPPLQHRKGKWMRNLEYRVVAADADADAADDVVEEEEAGVVVVADAADDVVEEVEEAGVVVVVDAADDVVEEVEEAGVVVVVDADDGDEEAVEEEEEQLILPENAEVDVEEEEIEELTVKSPSMLIQERQDLAEESGKVIILLDTPDKTRSTATIVVDEEEVEILPSFEEIRSAMGFSPLNNTNDSIPHDEDLMGWHSPEAPRPNRRSIYDPIQIK